MRLRVLDYLTPHKAHQLETMAMWTLPTVGIPLLRLFQDKPEERLRLYIRDTLSYAAGSSLFFGVRQGIKNHVAKYPSSSFSKPHVASLAGALAGTAAYVLFAGTIGVKFSNWLAAKLQHNKASRRATHLNSTLSSPKGNTIHVLSQKPLPIKFKALSPESFNLASSDNVRSPRRIKFNHRPLYRIGRPFASPVTSLRPFV